MKKQLVSLVAGVTLIIGLSGGGVAQAAACSTPWGSGPKSAGPTGGAYHYVTDIRTGQHPCFDRMVIDVSASTTTGYSVQYVDTIYSDPEGSIIPFPNSGAKLQVVAYAQNHKGQTLTYTGKTGKALPGVNLTGYQTFREAKFAGSFEDTTSVGLGVRARLPFTVFKSGNNVVIDVAHKW